MDFPWVVLFCLVVAHAIADFPLQGDFLADAKQGSFYKINRHVAMFMHTAIHAGAVYFLTGWLLLAVFEWVSHWVIDELKVREKITFTQDQALHVLCKVMWTAWVGYYGLYL